MSSSGRRPASSERKRTDATRPERSVLEARKKLCERAGRANGQLAIQTSGGKRIPVVRANVDGLAAAGAASQNPIAEGDQRKPECQDSPEGNSGLAKHAARESHREGIHRQPSDRNQQRDPPRPTVCRPSLLIGILWRRPLRRRIGHGASISGARPSATGGSSAPFANRSVGELHHGNKRQAEISSGRRPGPTHLSQ